LFPSKKTKHREKARTTLKKLSLGTIKLFVPIKKNKAMGEAITPFKKRA
jgi:hypothetical protein